VTSSRKMAATRRFTTAVNDTARGGKTFLFLR
jgi:hypothetical protein